MAYHNETENAVDMLCRKTRSQSFGCSGCKQTLAKSRKDLKKATRAADNRLKLANREHSHQMQKVKLETGKIIKSLQVKIREFDKIVKGINANGQKFAQGTFVHQECHSRSSTRLDYEISGNELITQVKQGKEPKHIEENNNQEDEQQPKLLNSRMSRTEIELTAKKDQWKDLSYRLQKLEERNDILLETKHQHQDLVKKLESKSAEVTVLNKKLLETENNLSAKKDEFKDLTNKLKLLESQSGVIEKQKSLLESKEEQIRDLEKKLGDGEKRLADTLGKMDEQKQELEKNIERRSQFDQRIEKAEAIAQEAEDLYEKLNLLEQQNENLQQSKNDFQNIVLKQQGWFESRGAQLQNLENQLQERDDMLVEASRKIDELRQELESNYAELSGMDERRAKAEATAWELMQTPLLSLDSNVMTTECPERKMTNSRSTSLKDGRRIRKKHLIPVNGLTIDIPSEDTVSDMSEFEEKSSPSNSDLEEFEREPIQTFGDAHFFPEVKSGEPYSAGEKGYSPTTIDSSSSFGSTISSSADQSTRNKLTLTVSPEKEKSSYCSTCSSEEQSHSKDESFTQSNVTSIKMLSSDASLSESCSSSMFDPLISKRPEKNVEINSPTTNSVEVYKDQELSQKLAIATERWFKVNGRVATLEEELTGKDNLLKKRSLQLKKYAVELSKYKLTSKNTTKTPTSSASDDSSVKVILTKEETLDRRVQKLEEELNRKNTQIAIEKDKISSLECKFQKRSQAITKLIKKIGRLQNRLLVRDDLIATFSERASKKSDENILRAIEIMENGLNNLFDCFKICSLDLGSKVQELQKRTVDLKHYVAESSSEGFSQQYSLKSIPIKNCIIAISKNFVKHQEEMYSFNRNFRKAVASILRYYKRAATSEETCSSSESKSSRFLSSSLNYLPQESLLSSIEIPAKKRRLSSSLGQKNYPYFQTKVIVEDEPEDSTNEKTVADKETSHSKSSLFAVFTSESEKDTNVLKRYKSKKSLGHNISASKHRSSYPEKMRGKGQVDLTPKAQGVTIKKCIDEDARVFKSENSHKKTSLSKSNRKQVNPAVATPRRRHYKAKTLKQFKKSRPNISSNALLGGLGYSTSPSI